MNGTISLQSKLKGAVSMANTIINGGASPYPKGASGSIITITDGAENTPLKSAVVSIEPVQSGSGDPSPTNIRPISGWSEVNVWVKPTYDTTLTPTVTIPLGQTVYGGTQDVVRGKLVIDRVYANISQAYQANWGKSSSYPGGFYLGVSTLATLLGLPPLKSQTPFICSHAKTATTIAEYLPGTCFCDFSCNIRIMQASNTVNDWKAYLQAQEAAGTPVQAVFKLATPIEVDLTPQTIKTLLGVNNIWADAGSMEIEYYPAAASIVAVQNRSSKAYVSIPLGMIRYETYQITPQQTIDLDSYRSENGNLLRNPVATKCKLEFNTPLMTDSQWAEIWNIIKAGFNNNTERKLKLKYYDTLSATYKTGYFYVPDVQTTIRNIEEAEGVINYQEIRLAFIEY